ncbi:hypothetical protein [Actinokineospora sp. NBRC 105648]|uniref:hypothetical protein n=1 Tax=Actinokineospora sp. NBRC 105648 TaxID=3032206 RepID=UPI0024A173F0|nr:hypothetical protein [Actinokineospora sp. NBRC 105648]GLZ41296.1 hypothetical protein Acsp05_49200 [Actinokineospora sp. NBRC 105648]
MSGFLRTAIRGKRTERALASARVLDRAVDNQLACVAGLPADARERAADHLAELVLLAQAYRHYANGWISHRELDHRGRRATARLTELRAARPTAAHLTERD